MWGYPAGALAFQTTKLSPAEGDALSLGLAQGCDRLREGVAVKERGLSQPGGGTVRCEKPQVSHQRGAVAGAGQRLQADPARQQCGVCSDSPLLQPCYGLCCAGLTSHPALVGMQLVSPSKPSRAEIPVSAPIQDQSCTFSPCSPREDPAQAAPVGFCFALLCRGQMPAVPGGAAACPAPPQRSALCGSPACVIVTKPQG